MEAPDLEINDVVTRPAQRDVETSATATTVVVLVVVSAALFVASSRSEFLWPFGDSADNDFGFASYNRWFLVTGVLLPFSAILLALASIGRPRSTMLTCAVAALVPATTTGLVDAAQIAHAVLVDDVQVDGVWRWVFPRLAAVALAVAGATVWVLTTGLLRRSAVERSPWLLLAMAGLGIQTLRIVWVVNDLADFGFRAGWIASIVVGLLMVALLVTVLLCGARRGALFVVAVSLIDLAVEIDRLVIFGRGVLVPVAVDIVVTGVVVTGAAMIARATPAPGDR